MTTTAAEAIRTLFAPQSVAVIGASREPSSRSARLINNLRARFTGPIYPVNPNADEIMGLPAYPAAAAIGGQVDVAAVMVSAGRLLPALEQCARPASGRRSRSPPQPTIPRPYAPRSRT